MRLPTWAAAGAMLASAGSVAAQQGQEITAPGPIGDLHGTYIAPEQGKPIVLIVPGSGPTDRDGNNPLGVHGSTYRLLAEGLTERGIGSVRIDKRGLFASAGAVADANDVTIGSYVADVASWVAAIRRASGAECVWLAGHSEGGLVTLAAAQKVDGLCGLILISAPGRPLGTIIREQLEANPANAPLLADAFAAIDRLERGERVDVTGLHPALQPLFAPQVQGFLIDVMARDPARLAAATDLPMLIVQGDKDIQVLPADAEALHAAQPRAGYVVVRNANHLLKVVESDSREANLATYADPDLSLAPGVVDTIAGFMTGMPRE